MDHPRCLHARQYLKWQDVRKQGDDKIIRGEHGRRKDTQNSNSERSPHVPACRSNHRAITAAGSVRSSVNPRVCSISMSSSFPASSQCHPQKHREAASKRNIISTNGRRIPHFPIKSPDSRTGSDCIF